MSTKMCGPESKEVMAQRMQRSLSIIISSIEINAFSRRFSHVDFNSIIIVTIALFMQRSPALFSSDIEINVIP